MAVDFWRGILYAVNRGDDTVSAYRIRPNGRLVPLAVSNAGIMPYGIAIDPFGRFLYVTNIDQPNPEPFGPVSGRAIRRVPLRANRTGYLGLSHCWQRQPDTGRLTFPVGILAPCNSGCPCARVDFGGSAVKPA